MLGDCSLRGRDFVKARLVGTIAPLVGVGNGVDGYLGGVEDGVLNIGADVIRSRKLSNCFSERALCSVSSGLIGGTPPHPSIAIKVHKHLKKMFP